MNKMTMTATTRRKSKSSNRLTMWIRRIHLYSGLLMFPWVLLYGFTALLFNRPHVLTDSRTEIRHLQLDPKQVGRWYAADELATSVAGAAFEADQNAMRGNEESVAAKSAYFSGTFSYSRETDSHTETLTIDPNSGSAVHRITSKPPANDNKPTPRKTALAEPFPWTEHQADVLAAAGVEDAEKWTLQRQPALEFWSVGESSQLYRFTPTSRENRGRGTTGPGEEGEPNHRGHASGDLIVVGQHPRDVTWRNYFLRLHTAHGYPFEMNARWFWAITVDAMFACMVFWGFSGLIMWWQIKRTRMLGAIAIVISMVLAVGLAIAMHWEMVHG
ncbi:MAG: hypothetical protein JNL67_17520 [Planctomycetaceae bacterium]|nr:hypothetical protein [Planctomycetaceae bacterium]